MKQEVISAYDPITGSSWLQKQTAKWKRDVAYVLCQIRTLTLLLKHPRTPWLGRIVAGCSVGYLVSPIQLIPTFIPIIGQMDDLLVLFLGMKLLRILAPADVLEECQQRAAARSVRPKAIPGSRKPLQIEIGHRPPSPSPAPSGCSHCQL